MPTLLSSSCSKMSRACQPSLFLITRSPSTIPKGGVQLQACKLTNWKKKWSKTNIQSFIGMEKLLPILAIVKSQGVPPSSVKLHPFLYTLQSQEHGKGTDGRAGTGTVSATLRSLENIYHEGSNQVPQEYLYERPLQRCQDTGFAGHASIWSQRGKLSSP